jgi:thioredoxin 1
MKKIGLIITLLVVAIMVAAITIKLSSPEESGTSNQNAIYEEVGAAGKLSAGMIGITTTNYDEVITNSNGIVVVDYFAPTCSHCITYATTFASVFEQYKDKAVFGKFDVTTDQTKIASLNIGGTPTTIIFKDGAEAERVNGAVDEAELKSKIDGILAK